MMDINEMSDRLMTKKEAARLLHIKESTISTWVTQKKLRKRKIAGKTLIDRNEVESLLQKAFEDYERKS